MMVEVIENMFIKSVLWIMLSIILLLFFLIKKKIKQIMFDRYILNHKNKKQSETKAKGKKTSETSNLKLCFLF